MHYNDVIMGAIASQITSLMIVYSTVYSDADQIKHQSSASLAFVRGIHRGPVNSPHKWPVTPKRFPFDYVIMDLCDLCRKQCRRWSGEMFRRSMEYYFGVYFPSCAATYEINTTTILQWVYKSYSTVHILIDQLHDITAYKLRWTRWSSNIKSAYVFRLTPQTFYVLHCRPEHFIHSGIRDPSFNNYMYSSGSSPGTGQP